MISSSQTGNLLAPSIYGRSKSSDGGGRSKNSVTFSDNSLNTSSNDILADDDSSSVITQHSSDAASLTSSLFAQIDTSSDDDGYGYNVGNRMVSREPRTISNPALVCMNVFALTLYLPIRLIFSTGQQRRQTLDQKAIVIRHGCDCTRVLTRVLPLLRQEEVTAMRRRSRSAING